MTTATIRKPADELKTGDRIHAEGVNWLTVLDVLTLHDPDDPGVEVDIRADLPGDIWDPSVLAAAVGAGSVVWVCGPDPFGVRYRLFYGPDAEVEVQR